MLNLFFILLWKNLPLEGAFVHCSNVVLEIPGIENALPFDNFIVKILLGRFSVRSVIQLD